jgi:hypothetical protein
MSPDLKNARVQVSSPKPSADSDEILTALRHAGKRLRHELGGEVRLRTLPRLDFAWDRSGEEREHLETLIARGLPRERGPESAESAYVGAAVPAAISSDELTTADRGRDDRSYKEAHRRGPARDKRLVFSPRREVRQGDFVMVLLRPCLAPLRLGEKWSALRLRDSRLDWRAMPFLREQARSYGGLVMSLTRK